MLYGYEREQKMQWSKLKTRLKAFIHPDLAARLDFHVTSYRHSHDEAEKAWITLDGRRIATFSWYQVQWTGAKRDRKGRLIRNNDLTVEAEPCGSPAWIHRKGLLLPQDFGDAVREYLDLPVAKSISSVNPVIRALALVDRRTGAGSLARINVSKDDHPLILLFHNLRLSCPSIHVLRSGTSD